VREFAKLLQATTGFMSLCPFHNWAAIRRIFMKFDIEDFHTICRGNSSFATMEPNYHVLYMKTCVLEIRDSSTAACFDSHGMKEVAEKVCGEIQRTHFV